MSMNLRLKCSPRRITRAIDETVQMLEAIPAWLRTPEQKERLRLAYELLLSRGTTDLPL